MCVTRSLGSDVALSFSNVYIIPFDGPVRLDLGAHEPGALSGAITYGVGIDLSRVVDPARTNELSDVNAGDYQADENGTPFGLDLYLFAGPQDILRTH